MTYCRFSNNDFQCDLYIYKSSSGYETHVARLRRVYRVPLPPSVPVLSGGWMARHLAISAMEEGVDYDLVPIGLPHDGASFTDDHAIACANRVEALRALGYRCSDYVVADLRGEGV